MATAAGRASRRSGRKRGGRWWCLLPAGLIVPILGWLGGFAAFVEGAPNREPVVREPTDAIVVLTGGSDRVRIGVELLAAGAGAHLFVSGVPSMVPLDHLLGGMDVDDGMRGRIELGRMAENTLGNARETAAWVAENDHGSLRLVTAWYHMPRSRLAFRRAMPDVEIVTHPVFPETVVREQWWQWPGTTRLLIGEYHKYLAAFVLLGPRGSRFDGVAP